MEIVGYAFIAVFVGALLLGRRFKATREAREAAELANVPSRAVDLRVSGWTASELRDVFRRFSELYGLPEPRVSETANGVFSVKWTDGLAPSHILFAVNYAHYPEGHDLDGRRICAAAKVSAGHLDGIPAGRPVTIYVPEDDDRFDCVHAVDDRGTAYLGDFGQSGFVKTERARMRPCVQALFG
ncbi:hypothetical protein KUV75_03785 [Qipengyuania gaetbuli]|uniref:hypothetical protein n=1 Tax=Qipengyuania gaetbuli TaxID=266952 RepID=UPI001C9930D3|nr:hypothetical protein [Qipengyuania gaetbuli]MBY6014023.1 hypothetical protein [Qipengyuania gaetbuli]